MIPDRVGRYEIKSEIARGGMAAVYLARDPRFQRDVAIKLLSAHLISDPAFRTRFEREAQTIAALEHPAIVPVYDFGEEGQQLYLVMRYMTGGSLSERLRTKGPLPLSTVVEILSRLAPALDAVHAHGIIHRDLKPGNILFDQYGNSFLADFGIARLTEATTTLTGDAIIGTPSYMSPEQVRGDHDIDGRSDIYALGAILFEMLTAHQPYEATTPMGIALKHLTEPVPRVLQYRMDLPAETEAVIEKAMAKDRDRRYPAAVELVSALDDISRRTRAVPVQSPEKRAQAFPMPAAGLGELPVSAAPSSVAREAAARNAVLEAPAHIEKKSEPVMMGHGVHQGKRSKSSSKLFAAGGVLAVVGVCGVAALLALGGYFYKVLNPGAAIATATLAIPSPISLDLGAVLSTTNELKPALVESAMPEPRLTPTLGLSLFRDDFSDPESGWYRGKLRQSFADYAGGSYQILVDEPNAFLWSTPDLNFANVAVEVEATKVAGSDENYFGVICRVQDTDNFYMLVISSSGYYTIGKYSNGQYSTVGMNGWEYSSSVHQGKTTNRIRAECNKDQITLTVNQIKLVQVIDNEFQSGDVGLVAAALSVPGTNILFDNFAAQSP